jgi:hypothetical protein
MEEIDLALVRAARQRLHELAQEHPELQGSPSPENEAAWLQALEAGVADETLAVVAFRFDAALIRRLDKQAERFSAELGTKITRSDAVRMLLTRALDDAEARSQKGTR